MTILKLLTESGLTALVEQAQRPEVGAVGAKLLYPDNRIQHAGVTVGIFGGAGHAFRKLPNNRTAYFGLADLTRNCSAVTAACMIVPRKVFNEVGGFDEELKVVYNDVDLCLEDPATRLSYFIHAICGICTTLSLLPEDACGRSERRSCFADVGATLSESEIHITIQALL